MLRTFGDSVLDCARYNERGLDPGQLIVRNDDTLFPEFRGRDLHAHFMRGNPDWYTRTIEPSLVGASEIRRVFLAQLG